MTYLYLICFHGLLGVMLLSMSRREVCCPLHQRGYGAVARAVQHQTQMEPEKARKNPNLGIILPAGAITSRGSRLRSVCKFPYSGNNGC